MIPDSSQLRELPVMPAWSDWANVPRVKAALSELESGVFGSAAALVDAMGRDERISGTMATRIGGVLGLPLSFAPQRDGVIKDSKVAKALEYDWYSFAPEAVLSDLLRWGLMLGIGIARIDWKKVGARSLPMLRVWHPQYCYWDTDREAYFVHTRDNGPMEVNPGDGYWFVFTPYGYRRGWMRGLVRSLAIPWLVRQFAVRDWARYSEAHGLPVKRLRVPANAKNEDIQRVLEDVRALGRESTIALPTGADGKASFGFDYAAAPADNHVAFKDLIEQANTSIAVCVLGQNLTTEVQGGSFAAAKIHGRVRDDVLRFDTETLSSALREGPIAWWAQHAFGSKDLAPWPVWEIEQPEDTSQKATTLKTLGEALSALASVGIAVDRDAILQEFNVPVLKNAPTPVEQPTAPTDPQVEAPVSGA